MTFSEYLKKKKVEIARGDRDSHFMARNSPETALFFQQVFPGKVQVLDYHVPDVGVEFACRGLSAPRTCAVAKDLAKGKAAKTNSNSFLLFDEDLLAMHAFNQSLFHHLPSMRISRHEATLKLRIYLDEHHRRDSLPRMCVSRQQRDWLWNSTLWMEEFMSQYNYNYTAKSEETLLDDFVFESKKFCHLDTTAVLRDSKMRSYLQSCHFIQPNVTTNTTDDRICS